MPLAASGRPGTEGTPVDVRVLANHAGLPSESAATPRGGALVRFGTPFTEANGDMRPARSSEGE